MYVVIYSTSNKYKYNYFGKLHNNLIYFESIYVCTIHCTYYTMYNIIIIKNYACVEYLAAKRTMW